MKTLIPVLMACAGLSSAASVVDAQIVAQRAAVGPTLPANTLVYVSLNAELTSKRSHKDDVFDVSVTRDVIVGDYVVIPRGTPGHGRIGWRTGKGAFGKSAKIEFDLVDLEVGNQLVPVSGHYRLEGDGGTGATLGVMAAGALVFTPLAAAFVTGHSASAAQGTEYRAFTRGPTSFAYAGSPGPGGSGPAYVGAHAPGVDPYEAGRRAAAVALASADRD